MKRKRKSPRRCRRRRCLSRTQYEEQRGKELADIIDSLLLQLHRAGLTPRLPIGGIGENDYITDVNSGEFMLSALVRARARR